MVSEMGALWKGMRIDIAAIYGLKRLWRNLWTILLGGVAKCPPLFLLS
jgi:hypothetical protein